MKLSTYLSTLEYPGRGIVLGLLGQKFLGIYFVTARSASSNAKKYVLSEDQRSIQVQTTNLKLMARGKLDLLQYTAIRIGEQGFVVGNGRQVDAVDIAHASNAPDRLTTDLQGWSYEDDAYHTPRITGYVTTTDEGPSAALQIIRSNEIGSVLRNTFEVPLASGEGRVITTYRGENVRPTPAFQGEPVVVHFSEQELSAVVQCVYDALAPQEGKEDLRLSVMGVTFDSATKVSETSILNSPQIA